MSKKPIFVATHPRACSTAFERVFLTCNDTLKCLHEPFGFPYYYGPERLNDRFEDDEATRIESGCSNDTFQTVFDAIERDAVEGKRIFIKDMAQYWIPTHGKSTSIAPSLLGYKRGVGTSTNDILTNSTTSTNGSPTSEDSNPNSSMNGSVKLPYPTPAEPGNPTVVPEALLSRFHFTFLIRHPRSSIPSYYRCTLDPLKSMTGWEYFDPAEAGYSELRRFFDYVREKGHIGPKMAGFTSASVNVNGTNGTVNGVNGHTTENEVEICVIDADDLLDDPYGVIEAYCKSVGIPYSERMLKWDDDDQKRAIAQFESWKGFHEDAIYSNELKPRAHKKAPKPEHELYRQWVEKYGKEAANMIKKTVDENVEDYEYLKQFAIKV